MQPPIQAAGSEETREPFERFTPAASSPPARWGLRQWGTFGIVLGIWAMLFFDAARFVDIYGRDLPRLDEWSHIESLLQHQVTFEWLWSQSNEHRIPLPKFIWWALTELTGSPYLPSMYFNVVVLAGTSLAFVLAAACQRGVPRFTDALYPLFLLHWGHWENLIWGHQVQFISSTCLAAVVFFRIAAMRGDLKLRDALLISVCLVGLALCGANGLAYVPLLSIWLATTVVPRWGVRERTSALIVLPLRLAMACAPLLVVGLIYVGYQSPGHHPPPVDVRSVLLAAQRFLAMTWGAPGLSYWPFSGILISGLLLSALFPLIRAWFSGASERSRSLGLLACLLSLYGLALGVGYGRATTTMGMAYRYVTLAALGPCWVAFLWDLYGPPRIARWIQWGLFCIAILIWWPNHSEGARSGQVRAEMSDVLLRRVKYKVPSGLLGQMFPVAGAPELDPIVTAQKIALLRRVHFGSFEPVPESISLTGPLPAHRLTTLKGEQHGNRFTGSPILEFEFQEPQYVSSLHLKYQLSVPSGSGPAFVQIGFNNIEQPRWSEVAISADGMERTLDITIKDVVRGFSIAFRTHERCTFILQEAALAE